MRLPVSYVADLHCILNSVAFPFLSSTPLLWVTVELLQIASSSWIFVLNSNKIPFMFLLDSSQIILLMRPRAPKGAPISPGSRLGGFNLSEVVNDVVV